LQKEERDDQAEGQNASPDQPTHVHLPDHVPEITTGCLILEWPPVASQGTVRRDTKQRSGGTSTGHA
jgi:hypothetical protein